MDCGIIVVFCFMATQFGVFSAAMRPSPATFSNVWLAAAAAVTMLFVSVTLYIFNVIYKVQPLPFLDEIFHIPQAEKYCRGHFNEWDPKITTLPGLYLLSVGVLRPLSSALGIDVCGTYALRMTNVFACFANFYIIYNIQKRLFPERTDLESSLQDLLSAVNLAIFPVLYFFTFLYYTDVIATGVVLLTYLLQLEGHTLLASLTASIAVLVRQTNIVWVAFIAFLSTSHVLKLHVLQYNGRLSSSVLRSSKYLQVLVDTLLRTWKCGFASRAQLADSILYNSAGFVVVGLCFLGFVFWNGGLVVGDRSAHQAVFNIPQLFYFFLFVATFSCPYIIGCVKQVVVNTLTHWKLVLMLMVGCIIVVHFNTLVHPYLLADNRHYTFYVWKRLYERHLLMKYLLIPVYIFGAFSVNQLLKETDLSFQAGYFVFTALCLVPQKLLEFRYFIVPFLLLRLHICLKTWWQLIAEFILFFFINASTIYLFITRTFYWADSEEVQRFLW